VVRQQKQRQENEEKVKKIISATNPIQEPFLLSNNSGRCIISILERLFSWLLCFFSLTHALHTVQVLREMSGDTPYERLQPFTSRKVRKSVTRNHWLCRGGARQLDIQSPEQHSQGTPVAHLRGVEQHRNRGVSQMVRRRCHCSPKASSVTGLSWSFGYQKTTSARGATPRRWNCGRACDSPVVEWLSSERVQSDAATSSVRPLPIHGSTFGLLRFAGE